MAPYSPVQRRDELARHVDARQIAGTAGGAGAFSPITITVFVPPTTTANPTLPQTISPLTTSPPPPPPPPPAPATSTAPASPNAPGTAPSGSGQVLGGSRASTPSVSVVPSSTNTANQASGNLSANSSALSPGAIVGIVIAVLVLIGILALVLLRRKNIFARQQRRATWLSKGGIMGPKPIPEYDNASFVPTEKQAPPAPPVVAPPAGFGISSRDTYVPGGATEAAAFAYSTNSYIPTAPQAVLAPPPSSYLNPTTYAAPDSPVVMKDGQAATVLCSFIPTLPDELNINNGDVVRVIAEYDDGWALCMNANNEQGMVPLECLDRTGAVPMSAGKGPQGPRDPRDYKRVSSLTTSSGMGPGSGLAPNRFY